MDFSRRDGGGRSGGGREVGGRGGLSRRLGDLATRISLAGKDVLEEEEEEEDAWKQLLVDVWADEVEEAGKELAVVDEALKDVDLGGGRG